MHYVWRSAAHKVVASQTNDNGGIQFQTYTILQFSCADIKHQDIHHTPHKLGK